MPRPTRSLALIVAATAIVAACSSSEYSVTPKLTPGLNKPLAERIEASDSAMHMTTTAYPDHALVLTRTTALPNDITVTALIDANGGTLSIPAAGVTLDIRRGSLSAPTQISMTAKQGTNVLYEFAPHGITFKKPVKITQDLRVTTVTATSPRRRGMHGAYYTSADSAYVDADGRKIKVDENELGYDDDSVGNLLAFYVGHFSGYMVACGFN